MEKNKQLYLSLIILGYCVLMIGVFIYFSRKEVPQVKPKELLSSIVDKTSQMGKELSKTTPNIGPTITVIFAPTPVIEKGESLERKGWNVYANKKYNYSIDLPKEFAMRIGNVNNVRISKAESKIMYPVNYINVYASINDATAEKMDTKYRYLNIGESTDYEKTKVKITRLPKVVLKNGITFRVFENKNMNGFINGTRNIFFTYENDKVYVAINAYIEGKDFTSDQLKDKEFTKTVLDNYISEKELNEIVSTFSLLN